MFSFFINVSGCSCGLCTNLYTRFLYARFRSYTLKYIRFYNFQFCQDNFVQTSYSLGLIKAGNCEGVTRRRKIFEFIKTYHTKTWWTLYGSIVQVLLARVEMSRSNKQKKLAFPFSVSPPMYLLFLTKYSCLEGIVQFFQMFSVLDGTRLRHGVC